MSVPTTAVELIDWLEAYQFLRPGQADEMRAVAGLADARLTARELIHRDWLTPFQANQILLGHGDQLVLGAYRLTERLGEGAMGQVFKAWSTRLQQVVAVKTLHRDLIANARAMNRFRQEVEAAARLQHPNIVKVRDADEIDSRPFLVMDFVDGMNLSYLVKTQGPLHVHIAVECVRQAANGLQHAYERGVIHRDIKPANLLMEGPAHGSAPQTTNFCVKILDFGLARFDSERRYSTRLTQPGSTLGTVDYMAPEQAESARDADVRADIYGLGCTLFFLLAGRPPFPGTSVAEKIGARLIGPAPSVCEARPEVPVELDAVVRRMLARQPADRYQTPAEVMAALQEFTVRVAAETMTDVPGMEIDAGPPSEVGTAETQTPDRVAPARPMAVPAPPPPPRAAAAQPVVAAREARVLPPPAGEGLFATDAENPFALPPAAAAAPAGPTSRDAVRRAVNLRVLIAIGAGLAVLALLAISCSGYAIVAWFGGGPKIDAHPPGADLQITEAFVSSDVLLIGTKKNVIVKIHRTNFHGPVDVRIEGLPPDVAAAKVTIKGGLTAVEVPITAPFGIDPVEAEIRVIATAKNLTAQKTLKLRIVQKKGP